MIHKLGHTSELATVAITDSKLLDYIRVSLTALDDNYGADRDIDEDDGGYILYCERGTTHPDLLMMIDYEESICEYTTEKTRRNYMLSGLKILKCAECGAHLIGIADKTHGKEYIRYRCPNHKNKKCSTKDIRAEALNEYVAKLIVYKLFPKNALNKTNEMLAKADMSKELMKKRKITISAILQLTNNLEKVTSEALSNKLKEREDELKQIEIQIKKLKHLRITDEKAYRKIRSRIVKMLMNPNYDLRCLIANIVEEITVGNETIEVTLKL